MDLPAEGEAGMAVLLLQDGTVDRQGPLPRMGTSVRDHPRRWGVRLLPADRPLRMVAALTPVVLLLRTEDRHRPVLVGVRLLRT